MKVLVNCAHIVTSFPNKRKLGRLNYWKPFIAKEVAIVLGIAWYIKLDLLRIKQLPQYITHTTIDRMHRLNVDIQNQA